MAVLAARELAMLVLGRYGLSRGVELRINWPGRLAVAPLMGGFFFAMVGLAGSARCCCTSASRCRSPPRRCTCAMARGELDA